MNIPPKICTACSACVAICPKNCIVMQNDKEGFPYPEIKTMRCIHCNLCEKVCPVLANNDVLRNATNVYVAKNNDENIRLSSSSGGIFTLLAEQIIQKGGVVFGCRFNEKWEVVHDCTETIEGIAAFRGSKYVQSKIGNTFSQTKEFLDNGRIVLFSGTPCQISGLKHYLRKEYDNLLTVDFICHGVPSPKAWKRYMSYLTDNKLVTWGVYFRDKTLGWKRFSFRVSLR
jgi:coenzyme F420-reducing hydrogenase beta subunit